MLVRLLLSAVLLATVARAPRTSTFASPLTLKPTSRTPPNIPWFHQLTPAEAKHYVPAKFLAGSDHWKPEAEAATLS
jgi:hypothetical protein